MAIICTVDSRYIKEINYLASLGNIDGFLCKLSYRLLTN